MGETVTSIDHSNADTYSTDRFVEDYDAYQGWNDQGEMRVLMSIAPEVRGNPVLDVGVGTGRTTSLLRLLTDDYVGIDYVPEMIEHAKIAFPGSDLRVGDVLDLHEFDDGSKKLVMFSYNGLDSLDHDSRSAALANMARVTAPGGLLVYSTLNLESPHPNRKPWTPPQRPVEKGNEGALLWCFRMFRTIVQLPVHMMHRRRTNKLTRRGDGWAHAAAPGSGWRLILHFTTLARAKQEVAAAGLTLERVVSVDGVDITDNDSSDVLYFYLVARRVAS
jgi:ubiquinone/menaquinone biosynthesis C-methylase UbiE